MIYNTGSKFVKADNVKYGNNNVSKALDDLKTKDTSIYSSINSVANWVIALEDALTANGQKIYLDYRDGKYGYNTDPLRGADTFNPFSSGGTIKPVLLWTNSKPDDMFFLQTLSIDFSKYEVIMVKVKGGMGDESHTIPCYVPVPCVDVPLATVYYDSVVTRKVTVTNNSILIDEGYFSDGTVGLYVCIPVAIYGIEKDFMVGL